MSTARRRNLALVLGVLAVLAGMLLHKWAVELLVAPDENIESRLSIALIVAFQLAWIAAGAALIALARRWRPPVALLALIALAAVPAAGFGVYGNLRALGIVDPYRDARAAWDEVDASEELILLLTPELRHLERSARNLALPDFASRGLFADVVEVVDLAAGPPAVRILETVGVRLERQAASDEAARPVAVAELRLWRRLLDGVAYLERAHFAIVRGRFLDAERRRFETETRFDGLAREDGGGWRAVEMTLRLTWRRDGAGEEASSWRIARWHTGGVQQAFAGDLLFADVAPSALADARTAERVAREDLDRLQRSFFEDPTAVLAEEPLFISPSADLHPGIAVVDVDLDGWDDLYLTERWSPSLLLRNRGDGTFEDVTDALGLAVADHANAAIFADFDNDGDPDAFVGRSLGPSRYFVNEGDGAGGPRFVDRTASHLHGFSPCLVASLSAADVDGDGLLDIYAATYGSRLAADLLGEPPDPDAAALAECLPPPARTRWRTLAATPGAHPIINQYGPPNVLLRNRGDGAFEAVIEGTGLDVPRNTFQASWADFDDDGDADVYLANDFAPNVLLRNDGTDAAGTPRFVDVTAETATADVGFGMGASWGDYDGDGRLDLYVTNMYTKAGSRIVDRLGGLDPALAPMTRGNTLLRNVGDGFERVSGPPPALPVRRAGWAWGGQLADLDNDGAQDVYVPNGFYTVPEEYGVPVDL